MALTGLTKVTNIGINTTTIPTLGGSRNTGVVTATTFVGDGSGLSGVTGSGAGVIVRDGGSLVGTAGTINFGTNLNVSAISAGIVTVTNAASATALTNLSDVTVSSASNGQILKHNGSVFVNVAETDTTYSQSSVASGSNVNLRLTDSGGTNDDILITAGSNITFSSVSAGGFTIAASGGGGGGGLSNVVEDTTPQLGGSLDLNNKFITGSGGANISGVVTATSFVGNITGNVTGNVTGNISGGTVAGTTGTFTGNVTLGDSSTDTISMNGDVNTNILPSTNGNKNLGNSGNRWGEVHGVTFHGSGANLSGVVTSIVAGSNITLTGGPTGIVTIAAAGGGSGITDVIQDTTPQLGGNLDLNSKYITGTGGINVTGVSTATGGSFFGDIQAGVGTLGATIQKTNNSTLYLQYGKPGNISLCLGGGSVVVQNNLNVVGFSTQTNGAELGRLRVGYGNYYLTIQPRSGENTLHLNYDNGTTTKIGSGQTKSDLEVNGDITPKASGNRDLGLSTKKWNNVYATTFVGNLTGTATTATNVTVTANNSTDETVYPIFVDGTTGAQGAESDTGLTYNPNSGALTAGSFVKSGGSSSQFLKADGSVDGSTYLTSGSYIENVVEDTTPQLGGNLDLNSKNITGTGNAEIVGVITATSAVKTWTLGASGTDHYTFVGDGFTSATNDPDIYLERGKRYAFLNNAGTNHPLWIKTAAGTGIGNSYNDGVTNNGAQSGYLTFNVPWDAPAQLYYQCQAHGNMVGNIYIRGGASAVTYESAKQLKLGNNTSSSVNSSNLVNIDLGGTHHDTAGSTGKLRLWKDASDEMSLGVSSNQMDFILTSLSYSYNFYGGGSGTTKLMQLSQSPIKLALGNETGSGVTAPVSINLGGTYSSSAGNGNDLSAKLKLWTNGSDVMGLSVSGNQLDYIVTSENYDHVFYGGNAGTTELARFEGTGDLKFPNGKGINFGATEGSGATASVLDDYEEGVFTPTLSGGTSASDMYYTKIGRVVHISGSLAFDSISGSGNMVIGGLPYTSINGLDAYTNLSSHAYDSLNVGNQTYQFQTIRVDKGSTNMRIIIPAGNGNVRTFAQYSHVSSSTFRFRVAGYYITA